MTRFLFKIVVVGVLIIVVAHYASNFLGNGRWIDQIRNIIPSITDRLMPGHRPMDVGQFYKHGHKDNARQRVSDFVDRHTANNYEPDNNIMADEFYIVDKPWPDENSEQAKEKQPFGDFYR